MTILAIDPGPTESAYVLYNTDLQTPFRMGIDENEHVRNVIDEMTSVYSDEIIVDLVAIEMIQSFGMRVGHSVFETCVQIGRMIEVALRNGGATRRVYRKDVKMHLCHSMRAKDPNIKQAIIDRYPPSGGGKTPQVGTKNAQGPLYGVTSHVWQALAVAITAAETRIDEGAVTITT